MNISEIYFYGLHPEEQEDREVEQVTDHQEESLKVQFDCLFLLDLIPEEKEWIFELMRSV
jgi:hypothetical protein